MKNLAVQLFLVVLFIFQISGFFSPLALADETEAPTNRSSNPASFNQLLPDIYHVLFPYLGPLGVSKIAATDQERLQFSKVPFYVNPAYEEYFKKLEKKNKSILKKAVQSGNEPLLNYYLETRSLNLQELQNGLAAAVSLWKGETAFKIFEKGAAIFEALHVNPDSPDSMTLNGILPESSDWSIQADPTTEEFLKRVFDFGLINKHLHQEVCKNFISRPSLFEKVLEKNGQLSLTTVSEIIQSGNKDLFRHIIRFYLNRINPAGNVFNQILEISIKNTEDDEFLKIAIDELAAPDEVGNRSITMIPGVELPALLKIAIEKPNIPAGKLIVQAAGPALKSDNLFSYHGHPALHHAVRSDSPLVADLLKAGANSKPEIPVHFNSGSHKMNLLHLAAMAGSLSSVKSLVAAGMDIHYKTLPNDETKGAEPLTALDIAAKNYNTSVISYLISLGADHSYLQRNASSLLCESIAFKRTPFAIALLTDTFGLGLNLWESTCRNLPLLYFAVETKNFEIAQLLLGEPKDYSKNFLPDDRSGQRLLDSSVDGSIARSSNSSFDIHFVQFVSNLLRSSAKLSDFSKKMLESAHPPKEIDYQKTRPETVSTLEFLRAISDDSQINEKLPDSCKTFKMTALGWAIRYNLPGAIRKLIEDGASSNEFVECGTHFQSGVKYVRTALENAILSESWELVDLLMGQGARINPAVHSKTDREEFKRLLVDLAVKAAQRGHLPLLENIFGERLLPVNQRIRLLEKYTDIGGTPLMHAAQYGHPEAVSYLLTLGARPSVKSNLPQTPDFHGKDALWWARRSKKSKVIRMIKYRLLENADTRENPSSTHKRKNRRRGRLISDVMRWN